ncbi:Y-family DNA polymerase [Lacticaseibacillus saniviri]
MDYHDEPRGVFFLIDNKSFYASVEASMRGLPPLETCLVVMSEQANTNGGLILATSPMAKKLFHLQANVSRQRDLPQDEKLIVVPPRMNLYIKRNLEINAIFKRFVADEDLLPYSIDESLLDLTHSWRLFGGSPRQVAERIQTTVREELGLYTTIGIGDNPTQAKLALDLYAKHNVDLIAEIHYQTVQDLIWPIADLTEVWGIGRRTADHLHRLGIHTMGELAATDPWQLKAEMGVIGAQLYATAWGVDRAKPRYRAIPKERSYGNSQVLPRDYRLQNEIETVIKEIGEQVASRLRHHHVQATRISLAIGFAYATKESGGGSGFAHTVTIDSTNRNQPIIDALFHIFRQSWDGQVVRNIAVSAGKLHQDTGLQLNLFAPPQQQLRRADIDALVDTIRDRFGFTALIYARSLIDGGTAIQRASLVGGHNGGNAYA